MPAANESRDIHATSLIILQCHSTPLSTFASQKVMTFSFSNGESNEGSYVGEEDGEKGRPQAKISEAMFY